MKKLFLLSTLIFSLVVGGCSQSSSNSEAKPTDTKAEQGQAQSDFPSKAIEIVVPYAPGGGTDTAARALASVASKYLPNGQSVVVVNKPGGASTVGITEVFNSKPDGYKLIMVTTTGTSIQPHFGKTIYSHDSFEPIIRAVSTPQVLVVKKDAPWKTFEEWLDYAKKNPGVFTYGSANAGGTAHLAMEAVSFAAGVQTKNVPFEGAAPAVTALMGGHVQGAAVQVHEAKAQIDAGEVRPLVNIGTRKVDAYKDTPLAKDKGLDAGLDVYTGLLAPKGTPKEVVTILHDAFKKSLEDPAVIEQFNKLGIDPTYAGPEEFQKDISDSFELSGKVLKQVGLVK